MGMDSSLIKKLGITAITRWTVADDPIGLSSTLAADMAGEACSIDFGRAS